MVGLQRQVAEIIRKDPAVDYVNSTVGAGGPNPTQNIGRMFIALTPRKDASNDICRRRIPSVTKRMRVRSLSFASRRI